jgi:hypothetical protein
VLLSTVPFKWRESSDLLAELSPNNCQSVGNSIAFIVKLLDAKSIVTGSVQQLYLIDIFVKELSYVGLLF